MVWFVLLAHCVSGLKPLDDSLTTMNFKKGFVLDLIEQYQPKIVRMWDDRANHVERFTAWLEKMDRFDSEATLVEQIESLIVL